MQNTNTEAAKILSQQDIINLMLMPQLMGQQMDFQMVSVFQKIYDQHRLPLYSHKYYKIQDQKPVEITDPAQLENYLLFQQQCFLLNQLMLQNQLMNMVSKVSQLKQPPVNEEQASSQKIRKKVKKSESKYSQGHWTQEEHQLYLDFLTGNRDVMESSELKKVNKIFKRMSEMIATRSPSQCRSHHQKFNPFSKMVKSVEQFKSITMSRGESSKNEGFSFQIFCIYILIMIHKFFGLILEDKKKFVFPKREGLFAYYITNLSSEGSNISVFGVSKKGKFRLATLNNKQDNFKTKLIINENNIDTIYAIGDSDSRVYITGYELSISEIESEDTKFHDEFRALQPRAERSIDSDEFEMMTKAQKKQYKQNNKSSKTQ